MFEYEDFKVYPKDFIVVDKCNKEYLVGIDIAKDIVKKPVFKCKRCGKDSLCRTKNGLCIPCSKVRTMDDEYGDD